MLKYNYNSNFYHYFDRDQNLNVFFAFNFINFLRLNTSIPLKFLNNNLSIIKEQFDINLFLQGKDNVYEKFYIKKFDELSKIQLFDNQDSSIIFFHGKINIANLKGTYRVSAEVNYRYNFYDYIVSKLKEENINSTLELDLLTSKIIIEENYANHNNSKQNIGDKITFESDDINLEKSFYSLSNLFDIYQLYVTYDEYNTFINNFIESKKIEYDGTVPITKFLDRKQLSLSGEVDKENYEFTIMRLIQNNDIYLNYKEMSYEQNVFNVENIESKKRQRSQLSYEKLSTSLTTTACENNIFNGSLNDKVFQDSDILYVASFFNNVIEFKEDDFWKDDVKKIPIYLIDIFAKCKISYLSRIGEINMSTSWNQLTKQSLSQLKSGNYLCKIDCDKNYVNDYLIENYFILVK